MLKGISFPIHHVILMTREEYLEEASHLPEWWIEPLERKDVLFYTDEVDFGQMKAWIKAMPLHDEIVFFRKRAIF